LDNPQLKERAFWKPLAASGPEDGMLYPGYFFLSNETQNFVCRRAPRIGEHNDDIYQKELGLTADEINILKAENII
jgi:crotonobetainyl-CoA:carnitine CoA-transferase CaiB-like acyl-CoA transferase